MTILKAFRLDQALVKKLASIAKKSKRTEKFFVEEALKLYFKEYKDARIAMDRFNDPKSKVLSSLQMKDTLGV